MSLFLNKEDGYFSLTTAGEVAVIILIAVLVILTADRKSTRLNSSHM